MLFYHLEIQYEILHKADSARHKADSATNKADDAMNKADEAKSEAENEKDTLNGITKMLREINEYITDNRMVEIGFYYCDVTNTTITAVAALESLDRDLKKAGKHAITLLTEKTDDLRYSLSECKEITIHALTETSRRATSKGLLKSYWDTDHFDRNIYGNSWFSAKEWLIPEKTLSKAASMKAAGKIMADRTLLEELSRIYAKENRRVALEHPVHYKISAGSRESAKMMIDLLVRALHANGRLCGRRVLYLSNIEKNCHDEDKFTQAFRCSKGTAIAIETAGDLGEGSRYASGYEDVVEGLKGLIEETKGRTLLFLVELSDRPGFCRSLLTEVQDAMSFLEIREGAGSREQAEQYMKRLVMESEYRFLKPKDLRKYLPDQNSICLSDIDDAFCAWKKEVLRSDVYPSYGSCTLMKTEASAEETDAEKTLKRMVGLQDVKALVKQMISAYRVMEMRKVKGLSVQIPARHMLFTGNPGSAKTTVARLISKIFEREGILKKARLVECGRGDLVGKFVGWTAKIVEKKFREASGGMLFIDEAYALVEEDGLYGDEAIHTIVQQMENHREDVIVVFAGYKEKMNAFLAKNEGLRSRIAFHLDFPDYNAEELTEILKRMAEDRGFALSEDAVKYGRQLFEDAVLQTDFGNGRFVRNVFEQAQMRQADRLVEEYGKRSIPAKALKDLREEDFHVTLPNAEGSRRVIGF